MHVTGRFLIAPLNGQKCVFPGKRTGDKPVGFCARLRWKVMAARRINRLNPILRAVKPIDGLRRGQTASDAAGMEVLVSERRMNEKRPGRYRGQHIRKIKRQFFRILAIHAGDTRHVKGSTPAIQVAAFVIMKLIETATGHDHLEARVEGRRKQRIVTAQRKANHADTPGINLRHRLQ